MQLIGLTFVCACLSAFTGVAAAFRSPLRPDLHMAGSSLSDDILNPLIMQFNLYKDRIFVKSCYGAHINKDVQRTVLWLLPAECLDRTESDMIAVKYGYKGNPNVRFYLDSIDIRIHPGYKKSTKAHNIAIIQLNRFAYMVAEERYRFIGLPTSSDKFDNKTLEIYEYENTKYDVNLQEKVLLYRIKTKAINSFWCQVFYPFSSTKKNLLCASGWKGKGLSKDNLGVPLVIRDGSSFKLAGLATNIRRWTHLVSFPMEFLNIQSYLDWIINGTTEPQITRQTKRTKKLEIN